MSLTANTEASEPGLRFRPYTRQDLPAIFTLDEVCFAPPFRFSLAMMRRFAEAQNALTVVADRGGMIAGFCITHVEGANGDRTGYIVTLDVAPNERRRGVARQMIASIETQARAADCVAIGLHVSVENTGAIRFYERMGYVFWRPAPGFYGYGQDASVYRKCLCVST